MRLQVFRMDLSAVFLYDSVTDAQAQASAFANGLRGVKGVKDAIQIGKTIAIIIKAKHHAAIVAACLNPYALFGVTFQRVNGIIQQVQQDLFELVFIQGYGWQARLNLDLYFDIVIVEMVLTQRQNVLQ